MQYHGVQTWLKFLEQVLDLSYYLSYYHRTCMDGALLTDFDAASGQWAINFICGRC